MPKQRLLAILGCFDELMLTGVGGADADDGDCNEPEVVNKGKQQ